PDRLSVDEAMERIAAAFAPLEDYERVPARRAPGRVLVEGGPAGGGGPPLTKVAGGGRTRPGEDAGRARRAAAGGLGGGRGGAGVRGRPRAAGAAWRGLPRAHGRAVAGRGRYGGAVRGHGRQRVRRLERRGGGPNRRRRAGRARLPPRGAVDQRPLRGRGPA